jgi:hypothetical protein
MSKHIQITENPAMQFLSLGQRTSPKVQAEAEPVLTPLTEAKTHVRQDSEPEVVPATSRTEPNEHGMPVGKNETSLKAASKEIGAKIHKPDGSVKKELKRRRVNLIIRQSLSDDLEMAARMKEISFNEAFTRAIQAYVEAERSNLEAYKRFRAKIKDRNEDGTGY